MKQLILAAVLTLLPTSAVAQGTGRVVLIATDMKVLPDGRVAVTMPSGAQVTLIPTDVDLKMMQALAKSLPADPVVTSPDGRVEMLPVHDKAMPGIKAKCAKEWPTDFEMQAYCQKQQREALSKLWDHNAWITDNADGRVIRNKCQGEWPDDFEMRAYCEDQQYKALKVVK